MTSDQKNLTDLIQRLEAADGPSRELDCHIAAAIAEGGAFVAESPHDARLHAWYANSFSDRARQKHKIVPLKPYTASLDAALTLVSDLVMPGWCVRFTYDGMGEWSTVAGVGAHGDRFMTFAPTAALALCIAALKARLATDAAALKARELEQ